MLAAAREATAMPDNTQELVVVAHNLPEPRVQNLLSKYGDSLLKAKEVVKKASSIKVTSEDQTDVMQQARKVRLELKDIRVHVENTRVELKEDSLREGKAIDGMANIIKAIIVPVEAYLEKQEKFAEEQKKIRDEEKFANRIELLTPYVPDVSVYNVREMSNETFEKLLADSKAAYQAQKDAEKKAEEERLEQERKFKLHNERKNLLIPYWTFLKGDQISTDFGEIPEESFQIILKEAKEAQAADAAQREKIRKENEDLIKKNEAERKAKEDAEEKLRKEKEAQQLREKEEQEAREKKETEEAESKRKASMEPDKNKLIAFKNELETVQMPQVMSAEGAQAVRDIKTQMNLLLDFIVEKSNNL